MVIKVSEKPIISMDTGKVLGALKGLLYNNNQVTFLYCKFSEQYVYIPIQNASIGSDAIMLKSTEDIYMFHTDRATKVYTKNGNAVGTVTSIEIDDLFNITGIIVDELFIEIDKILHMDNIIIVDLDKKAIEDSSPVSIHRAVSTDVKDAADDQVRQQTNLVNQLFMGEIELSSISQGSQQSTKNMEFIADIENIEEIEEINNSSSEDIEVVEESTDHISEYAEVVEEIPPHSSEVVVAEEELNEGGINYIDVEDELVIEIDPRYQHLCGKRLLADITIVKETYEKGTLIDAPLVQFAINNNAIVKLIMNTDD